MKKSFVFYFQLILSVSLMAWLFWAMDVQAKLWLVKQVNWTMISLAVVLVNVGRVLMAYKWNILLKAKMIFCPFVEVVGSYYVSTFWGSFFPSSIGGDVIRIYQLKKHAKKLEDVVASVIMERVLGISATLLVALVSACGFIAGFGGSDVEKFFGMLAIFIIFVCLNVLAFNARLLDKFSDKLEAYKMRFLNKISEVLRSYKMFSSIRQSVWNCWVFSILEQFVPISVGVLVAQSMNLPIPMWSLFVFIPLVQVIAKLPLSLDGYGIREGLYVFLLSFVGLPGSEAFLFGMVAHLVGTFSIIPLFLYFSFVFPSGLVLGNEIPQR